MENTIKIPGLRDHAEYQTVLICLDGLQERLKESRAALCCYDEPRPIGSESHGPEDIDAAIAVHEKLLESARKGRLRCGLRIAALERAISIEEHKIPELRHQATELVGRAAREQYEKVLDEFAAIRKQAGLLMERERLIRRTLTDSINEQGPGYVSFDSGERFAWPVMGLFTNPFVSIA